MSSTGAPVGFRPSAFTVRYQGGRSRTLNSEIEIFAPSVPPSQGRNYTALYDTGATHSAISPRVVAALGLSSVGVVNVNVGGGTLQASNHIVHIGLPNRVMFQMVMVTSMELNGGFDVLIGMDILGLGDFAVTHQNGNTTFSFCCPSLREIDFVKELEAKDAVLPVHSSRKRQEAQEMLRRSTSEAKGHYACSLITHCLLAVGLEAGGSVTYS